MKITPPQYWRQNKSWSKWLGKVGKVLLVTTLQNSSADQEKFLPYAFALIDFNGEKKELMGIAEESFVAGDEVVCVLRKLSVPDQSGIIHYGIKFKKS